MEVILQDNDRVDNALKIFKRKVQRAGLMQELRRRKHYLKPSEAKYAKRQAAASRRRKTRRSN